MKYQHNSSNCGDCFGDVVGFSGMYPLLMVADGFTADMGSTWQIISLVISSGQNLNSAGFFGQATGANNWKKWSTSVCLLKEMNQMYLDGKITTGIAQTRAGPMNKALVYGEQIKLWNEFWPGFYQGKKREIFLFFCFFCFFFFSFKLTILLFFFFFYFFYYFFLLFFLLSHNSTTPWF